MRNPLLIATVVSVLAAPAAQAHGARLTFTHHHQPRHAHVAANLTVGMGNVQTLGCAHLPLIGTSFVRVIAGYQDNVSRLLPCAQAAHAAGLRVLLVVQWGNNWSLGRIKQRFANALNAYRSLRPFAIGVGNEQEGPWNDGAGESGAQYAAIWRAVEPMVASAFPRAIRIAGETAPWGVRFMAAAAQAGLPGAQAYAYHAYPAAGSGGSGAAKLFTSIARSNRVQAWADEGLCGPSSWNPYGCATAHHLAQEGFSHAAEWYDASRPNGSPKTTPIGYGSAPWKIGTNGSSPSPSALP